MGVQERGMGREGRYGGVTLVQAENKLGTLYHIQGGTVVGVCGTCVGNNFAVTVVFVSRAHPQAMV